ncbi:MAG TPA: hypothetical protein VGL11_22275 [Candidatus Binatia bacterium]|jgi:hypothetical protein
MARAATQPSKKNHGLPLAAKPAGVPQEKSAWRARELLAGFIFLAVASGLMAYIQFNPNNPYLSELDSYYHVKMAELLQGQGVPQKFPWLQFTILRDNYVNHHLLFHILLIPFTNLFGSVLGAKLFQVLVVGLGFLLFFLVLKNNNVRGAFGLSLFAVFTMSGDFYFRMSFIRDMGLSLAFMMSGIYLILKPESGVGPAAAKEKSFVQTTLDRKHLIPLALACVFFAFTHLTILIPFTVAIYVGASWVEYGWGWRSGAIFLVCAFYVWAYGGFLFLPIFALTYFVAQVMMGEKTDRRIPVAAFAGVIVGLALNPYFPKNLVFLYHQIFKTGLGAAQYAGGEWQPYDTWFWAQSNAVPIIIFFSGIVLALMKRLEQSAKTIAVFVFSLLFLVLVWKSKRFVEYSSFFMPLAGFCLIGPLLHAKTEEWKRGGFWKKAENVFYGIAVLAVLYVSVIFALLPPQPENHFVGQIAQARNDTQTLFSMSALKKVHGYLLENAAPGDIVFTDDWDVFPRYFFVNTKTYYIVGLDPEFMNQYAGEPYRQPGWLYLEFAQISSGSDANNLDRIKNHFKAKWVVVDTSHAQFYENLKRQPALFEEVLFATNDPRVDNYPAAHEDGYYLFKVL